MKYNIDYGILTAVPKEMAPYLQQCTDIEPIKIGTVEYTLAKIENKTVAMTAVGWGTSCAAAVMTHMALTFSPRGIFFTGTSGGIGPDLNQGDIVIGESAFEIELYNLITTCRGTPYEKGLMHAFKHEIQPNEYLADTSLLEGASKIKTAFAGKGINNGKSVPAKAIMGKLATSNNFPLRSDDYQQLKKLNVMAYAMEGSAIYQTSWLFNVPSLVVRGISNIYRDDGKQSNVETSETDLASKNASNFIVDLIRSLHV